MENKNVFRVTSGPFIRGGVTTGGLMYAVILALIPAALAGVGRFGAHALLLLLAAVVGAMGFEYAIDCLMGKDSTLVDGSAAVTGLLLGLSLPPDVPVYAAFIGAAVAVTVFKGLFGGLGKNKLNPALAGRCLLTVAFGGVMTGYLKENGLSAAAAAADPWRMLLGTSGYVIGGSVIALLCGAIWLIWKGVLSWRISVSALAAFVVFNLLRGEQAAGEVLFFLSGGGMLALCFMATDPVTSPVTPWGKTVFGVLIGILSGLFRLALPPAESACLSVLLADLAVPLLEKHTIPKANV